MILWSAIPKNYHEPLRSSLWNWLRTMTNLMMSFREFREHVQWPTHWHSHEPFLSSPWDSHDDMVVWNSKKLFTIYIHTHTRTHTHAHTHTLSFPLPPSRVRARALFLILSLSLSLFLSLSLSLSLSLDFQSISLSLARESERGRGRGRGRGREGERGRGRESTFVKSTLTCWLSLTKVKRCQK